MFLQISLFPNREVRVDGKFSIPVFSISKYRTLLQVFPKLSGKFSSRKGFPLRQILTHLRILRSQWGASVILFQDKSSFLSFSSELKVWGMFEIRLCERFTDSRLLREKNDAGRQAILLWLRSIHVRLVSFEKSKLRSGGGSDSWNSQLLSFSSSSE